MPLLKYKRLKPKLRVYLAGRSVATVTYFVTKIIPRCSPVIGQFSDTMIVASTDSEGVKPWSQGWLIAAGAYPGFCCLKRLEVFLLPLDGMLVHRRSLPRNFARFPQQFAGTHLYTWVERGTVRVKCLSQEHNTMSPARARTRTARSGVERTNHEATAPPHQLIESSNNGPSKSTSWKVLEIVLSHLKDVRANCFCASLLRTQIHMPHHATSCIERAR